MISHKYKFIFIHIPKTSGNSLSLFLKDFVDNKVIQRDSIVGNNQGISIICEKNNIDIKHKSISYYEEIYGDIIKNYYKFTIVRNPYDRILSFYLWSKGKKQTYNRKEFIAFINKINDFQYKYINDDVHIVYYENLINNLKKIKKFENIVNFDNYPMLNSSINSKIDYNYIYDKELKDLVYNKFKKDFETFNYKY